MFLVYFSKSGNNYDDAFLACTERVLALQGNTKTIPRLISLNTVTDRRILT